jgi:hypothetical protein
MSYVRAHLVWPHEVANRAATLCCADSIFVVIVTHGIWSLESILGLNLVVEPAWMHALTRPSQTETRGAGVLHVERDERAQACCAARWMCLACLANASWTDQLLQTWTNLQRRCAQQE